MMDSLGTSVVSTGPILNLPLSQNSVPQIPFPKIPLNACAGTACMEGEGITTRFNHIDPHPDCGKYCKVLMVHTHEAEYRKNMGSCCEKRNKCLNLPPPAGMDQARWRNICQKSYNVWALANALDFEQRAAVETCKDAKRFKKNCGSCGGPGDAWWECCETAKREEPLACGAQDPNAPIECCPFKDDGMVDIPCFEKNEKKYKQQGNPYPTGPTR